MKLTTYPQYVKRDICEWRHNVNVKGNLWLRHDVCLISQVECNVLLRIRSSESVLILGFVR
jgi:hypothetical protein